MSVILNFLKGKETPWYKALDPKRKYIVILREDNRELADELSERLREMGIDAVVVFGSVIEKIYEIA